jgi:hypothetical protein
MKITRRPPTAIPGLGDGAPAAETPASAPTDGGRVTDRVQLSEAARLRQRLRAEVGDPTAVRAEQVGALQSDIVNQTYAPSPRAVAERLLADLAADLLA